MTQHIVYKQIYASAERRVCGRVRTPIKNFINFDEVHNFTIFILVSLPFSRSFCLTLVDASGGTFTSHYMHRLTCNGFISSFTASASNRNAHEQSAGRKRCSRETVSMVRSLLCFTLLTDARGDNKSICTQCNSVARHCDNDDDDAGCNWQRHSE